MDKLFELVKLTLAVFRLTELIVKDDGPYDLSSRLRRYAGKNASKSIHHKTFADAIHCKYCTGIWFAILIFALNRIKHLKWIVDILAIAGGQSLIENAIDIGSGVNDR